MRKEKAGIKPSRIYNLTSQALNGFEMHNAETTSEMTKVELETILADMA
jgi:hypothetical protein